MKAFLGFVNVKRGLLRVWIVLSVLFMLGVAFVKFSDIQNELNDYRYVYSKDFPLLHGIERLIPVDCSKVRGVQYNIAENRDSILDDTKGDYVDLRLVNSNKYDCWYSIKSFRKLYPEYRRTSDDDLFTATYKKAGLQDHIVLNETHRPWSLLFQTIGFAIAMPLGVLALGSACYWALAGFKSTSASL